MNRTHDGASMPDRALACISAFALLAACSGDPDVDGDGLLLSQEEALGLDPELADTDRDGLSDGAEVELGTDPLVFDTDGDGLADGQEQELGADPLLADTDEDGYTDRDEVATGHDPADPEDRIYRGGWPYVFDKSGIGTDAGTYRDIGRTFYRMQLVDQHGEVVDLYDFYNADKPIVIDISAEWCPPCNALSSWIEGGDDFGGYSSLWSNGPKAVRRGEVHWITIMSEDMLNRPPTTDLAARWAELYPSKHIPVLADEPYLAPDYTGLAWWPYLILLEPDLTVSAANDPGYNFGDSVTVLQELNRRFP